MAISRNFIGGFVAGGAIAGAIAAIGIATGFIVTGVGPNHGDDPADTSSNTFTPKYFNVIYMKYGEEPGEAKLTARHAYFPVKGAQPSSDDVTCAVEYLRADGQSPDDCGVYHDQQYGTIRRDFENLGYGSQTRIYVFVDNQDVKFNKVHPLLFTQYGAFDDVLGSPPPKKKDRNRTIKGANLTSLGNSTYNGLYMENHYKNKNGGNMGQNDPHTDYSVNFNLVTCKSGIANCDLDDSAQVIPIIVDPDMGNGTGRGPGN